MDPSKEQLRRELELRREQERKDLETERTVGPRPLEGLSQAHTGWTEEQDDATAPDAHGHDERASRERSERQIPKGELSPREAAESESWIEQDRARQAEKGAREQADREDPREEEGWTQPESSAQKMPE